MAHGACCADTRIEIPDSTGTAPSRSKCARRPVGAACPCGRAWRRPVSGPGRDRTCDLGIKSPLLYQLSYRPVGPSVAGHRATYGRLRRGERRPRRSQLMSALRPRRLSPQLARGTLRTVEGGHQIPACLGGGVTLDLVQIDGNEQRPAGHRVESYLLALLAGDQIRLTTTRDTCRCEVRLGGLHPTAQLIKHHSAPCRGRAQRVRPGKDRSERLERVHPPG